MHSAAVRKETEHLPISVTVHRRNLHEVDRSAAEQGPVRLVRWDHPGASVHRDPPTQLEDEAASGNIARALIKLPRDGTAALHLSLPAATLDADTSPLQAFPGEVTLAAVGELRRNGGTVALVVRLDRAPQLDVAAAPGPAPKGLPKWRLKRALDFIEANLGRPIPLTELAAVAGLSSAYFGTQFRMATGLRPHEYILRQRIRRAQGMLLDPQAALVAVALSVGFQTQARFTTVFRRFVGAVAAASADRSPDSSERANSRRAKRMVCRAGGKPRRPSGLNQGIADIIRNDMRYVRTFNRPARWPSLSLGAIAPDTRDRVLARVVAEIGTADRVSRSPGVSLKTS